MRLLSILTSHEETVMKVRDRGTITSARQHTKGQRLGWCCRMRHLWTVRLSMGGPTDLLMMILKGGCPALSILTSHEERVMKIEDRGTITSARQCMWTVIRDSDNL